MTNTDKMKEALLKPKAKEPAPIYLSTGCLVLDLILSGKRRGGLLAGHCYHFVGISHSGKTSLAYSCFAEACRSAKFADHNLIFDDPDHGALPELQRLYGKQLFSRLRSPAKDKQGGPAHSFLIQDFYYNVDAAFDLKKPCIYMLDNMDALSSADVEEKYEKKRKVWKGDSEEKVAGAYGVDKAKYNWERLRKINSRAAKTGSIVIIISQAKDNIGFGSMFDPLTHSGGRALKAFATAQIWTTIKGKIRKRIRGRNKAVGIWSKVHVKKNRQTGQDDSVLVPIYNSYGIDDLGCSMNWLIDEKHWRGNETNVKAPEFDFEGDREELIQKIQEEGLEDKLGNLVYGTWCSIEDDCKLKRKPKYE